MAAPAEVAQLVARFEQHRQDYLTGPYNETQVRREFIDPLLKALGWDVANEKGNPEGLKEVVHEDAIRISGRHKAPDYSCRLGGERKFFVEAKKPSVNLRENSIPAYQLRSYGWSAKLPLSILTDFEEFVVYDCRIQPERSDKAATARIKDYTYRDYLEKWDELTAIFSPAAIRQGSLDQFAHDKKGQRGTAEVDNAFLEEISGWRTALADNIANNNRQRKLKSRQLSHAVQSTIDRLIFLRIAEDRGIEPYGRLRDATIGPAVYQQLARYFQQADAKYNSGLFYFQPEKGRDQELPDSFTLSLAIDDDVLRHIIGRLYFPDSPYQFDVIPAEILGQVYEQFLGKVIRLTARGEAKIEEKPEVKKAGGVYYTPTYIVDYIVRQTVGKLLEGKRPGHLGRLTILDPACGSGSFLMGAYQYLLDWHLAEYGRDPHKWQRGRQPTLYQTASGDYRLTLPERKRILLDHIYGVDIDAQAVEVTKLSLLLKVLEGETGPSLATQMSLFPERVLPDLAANIKCGNSLIGPDWYDRLGQLTLFDEEEVYRVNVFNWEGGFPAVMQAGGFNAVIGNPPYIFTRNQGIDEAQKGYFYAHYKYQSPQLNTFSIFVERCYALLCQDGLLGFITPNNWLTIDSFASLRRFILETTANVKIVNILDRVFFNANVDTAIILFEKNDPDGLTIAEMSGKKELFSRQVELQAISPPAYIIQINLLKDSPDHKILEQVTNSSRPLSDFCTVSTGLKVYQIGKGKPTQTEHEKKNRIFHATSKVNDSYGPYLNGVDVRRYLLSWSGEHLSYGDWVAEPRKSVPFTGERILVRQIPAKPPYLVHGVFTDEAFYNDINSMVIFNPVGGISLKYLLGLINSRLLSFWFLKKFDKLQRKIFPQFKVKELASFPIYPINFIMPTDRALYENIVSLVEQIMTLNRRLTEVQMPHEKTVVQRQIEVINRQIDQLVYQLYQLTPEEIAIVEAAPQT